jgi:hypothetical protein
MTKPVCPRCHLSATYSEQGPYFYGRPSQTEVGELAADWRARCETARAQAIISIEDCPHFMSVARS